MKKVSWVFAFAVAVVALCNAGPARAGYFDIDAYGMAAGDGETTPEDLILAFAGGRVDPQGTDYGIYPGLTLARNGGTWDGPGGYGSTFIRDSGGEDAGMTLGWFMNYDAAWNDGVVYNTFGGTDLSGGTNGALGYLLVKPTWVGDCSFDGKVDLTDVRIMSGNAGNEYDETNMVDAFMAGDMNYDGKVNLTDIRLWSGNAGNTGDAGGVETGINLDYRDNFVPPEGLAAGRAGSSVTATPEPGTLVLLAAGVAAMGFVALRKKK